MKRWTPKSLLDACEELLGSDRVVVTFRAIADPAIDARCYYAISDASGRVAPSGDVKIIIDAARLGYIPAVLHELLHVILHDSLLAFSRAQEEWIIRLFEERLWDKHFNQKRLAKWRRVIKLQPESSP